MSDLNGHGLYEKILSKDGALGLMAFVLTGFLMYVVYRGQEAMTMVHEELLRGQQKQIVQLEHQTQVLEDIRYALREDSGLTFRNSAQ